MMISVLFIMLARGNARRLLLQNSARGIEESEWFLCSSSTDTVLAAADEGVGHPSPSKLLVESCCGKHLLCPSLAR